jgi:DNA polymerase-3 subunit gamma/tau
VTVLSRCQRFDLRRIPAEKLAAHFEAVAKAENVAIEPEALAMIATAAEGSARDGLSMLDQAIAHGGGEVSAAGVRDMLGLADGGRIRRLLEAVLGGDSEAALAQLDEAHELGIDPLQLLRGLMEVLHMATRTKAGGKADALRSAEEQEMVARLAQNLSWALLHRLWQMLLKGLKDVEIAPDPREAADMALLRLIHAADLPDPAALLSNLGGEARGGGAGAGRAAAHPAGPSAAMPQDFAALVALVEESGKRNLALQLHDQVALVRFAPGELTLRPVRPLGGEWPRELATVLKTLTGTAWRVILSDEAGSPTMFEQEKIAEERVRSEVLADPGVRALTDAFPDAELESFATRGG